MTTNPAPDSNDEKLTARLREWQAPPASPWLAGRIAARVAAGRKAGWSLFPGPLKLRVAALTLAVVVGWSAGAFVSTPQAAADDGVELAEILW